MAPIPLDGEDEASLRSVSQGHTRLFIEYSVDTSHRKSFHPMNNRQATVESNA